LSPSKRKHDRVAVILRNTRPVPGTASGKNTEVKAEVKYCKSGPTRPVFCYNRLVN
jgi:hypothetical protein